MIDDLIKELRNNYVNQDESAWTTCREAADALEAQAKRIAELQQQVCSLIRRDPDDDKDARIAELEAENARLRELTKPPSWEPLPTELRAELENKP